MNLDPDPGPDPGPDLGPDPGPGPRLPVPYANICLKFKKSIPVKIYTGIFLKKYKNKNKMTSKEMFSQLSL